MTTPRKLTGVDMEVITSTYEMPIEEFKDLHRMLQRLALDQIERSARWSVDNPVGLIHVRGARWLVDLVDGIIATPVSKVDMLAGKFSHDHLADKVENALKSVLGEEQVLALDSLACLMEMRLDEVGDMPDDQVDAFTAALEASMPATARADELDAIATVIGMPLKVR